MDNQDASRYQPGRGLPTYLLSRNYVDSSTDSDGASRILAASSDSMTSDKDSDCSSFLHMPRAFSYMSTSSSITWSDTASSSTVPSTFEYQTSNVSRLADHDTITLRSDVPSMGQTSLSSYRDIPPNNNTGSASNKPTTVSENYPSVNVYPILPFLTARSNNNNCNIRSEYDYNSIPVHLHENMFTPYVPYLSNIDNEPRHVTNDHSDDTVMDKVETQSNNIEDMDIPENISYDECCLGGDKSVDSCGPTAHHHYGWSQGCVTFRYLSELDIRSHLKQNGIISKKEDDNIIMTEKNLIANRLLRKNIFADDNMKICPKHRSSFGIDWFNKKTTCHHPEHDAGQNSSIRDCRRANLSTCLKIEGFPVGGRLCSKHRKLVSSINSMATIMNDAFSISVASHPTDGSAFTVDNSRQTMNRILTDVNLSPIRSQTTKSIQNQSKSSLRRLVSKFKRGSIALQEKLADTLMPGQGQELIQIAQLQSQARAEEEFQLSISNEMVQSLKEVYDIYVKQKMTFIDQVRVLSLLPRSWKYEKVMEMFGCTRHAVTVARRMHDDKEYLLGKDQEPVIRQRADPEKVKHFISWLVESNTLVSGTYGLTTLRMDNGDKYELPKQIIQSQRSHALLDYKKYCDETGFESLGKSKLYDIINNIKPAEQRTVAGLDEFVVEGVEAWQSLSTIVEAMPIPQTDRKRLIKQIDMAQQYQKIRHIGHCSDDAECITHCTTFGLSDFKCAEHYSNCNTAHTTHCSDCINIIVTLDEINQKIEKITDKDIQREVRFDLENASEHIIEWSRHNLRAARQDSQKKIIISQMREDEAFCTFDWGQKILPQKYREPQSTYFGKKGMSVLVGSFVWQNPAPRLQSTSITTAGIPPPTYSTESYIVAITDAAQTELDTLSAGEIITKQFKIDHPHIQKLHKRTDNAGNFSSHSTPEAEKVICDRLGIELLTRDYSEVQKGKDICDRVCGVAKARMRSWIATGNDLLNAIDIKEGMEYVGGIKNTKIAVAEIVPDQGHLDKTNVPNVSTLRSIRYGPHSMNTFKASNIGTGLSVPYKQLKFEANMRVVSPFGNSIDEQQSSTTPKQRNDRKHHFLVLCPVSGCTAAFESNIDLETHIAANLHDVPQNQRRTANDIARLHLTELIRTTSIDAQQQVTSVFGSQNTSQMDLTNSVHYEKFSSVGWSLRVRKHTNPMGINVKNFIEKLWIDSQESHSKLTPQQVQQQIRAKRDQNGQKIFQTHEYPTLNQIKYRWRKIAREHGITPKYELIAELMENNV